MTEIPSSNFEAKKVQYFAKLGFQTREALKQHKIAGLWGTDWENVTKHCLVQVARGSELADALRLSTQIKKELMLAAQLHDVNKKDEITAARAAYEKKASVWEAFEQATQHKNAQLRVAGFSDAVIRLANAAPYGSIPEAELLLNKEELEENDIAFLILHYIDDISIGDDWVKPAAEEDNKTINQLDRRLRPPPTSTMHAQLNEEGRIHFAGQTVWEAAYNVGRKIEERLAKMVSQEVGREINPRALPEFIDQKIKASINALT